MCACVRACVHVCVHACGCVCVCVCMCTCMHVCICMHLQASLVICTCTEMTASLFAHYLLMLSGFFVLFSGCDVNLCEPIGNVTPLHVATNMHSDISLFRPMLQLLLRGRCILNWRAFSTLETPLYRSLGLEKVNHYGYVYMCIMCVFVCLLWLVCVCVCVCMCVTVAFCCWLVSQWARYHNFCNKGASGYSVIWALKMLITMDMCTFLYLFLPASCGCFYFGVTVVSFVVGLFLSGQDTTISATKVLLDIA